MALDQYKKKRDASRTPEPFGGKSADADSLRFVVQKHAASHLHYDFRLEVRGVLKSWAIPKGPSTDPDVKRLAVMVEDHPYDYRNFEGIIPKGQYGGGTVIVWDEGTYYPAEFEGKTKKEVEKHLMHGLHSGKLKIVLEGKKLKGEFAVVKAGGRGENAWLLMKLKDRHASKTDVTAKDKSVVSGKTLDQVAATSTNIYGSGDEPSPEKKLKRKTRQEAAAVADQDDADASLKKAKKGKMPEKIKPMLATLVDKPFDDPDWMYEVKWDGYRALAYIKGGKVELSSRNINSFTTKYYPVAEALTAWEADAVVDGEIMVVDSDGRADFGALQNWRSEVDGVFLRRHPGPDPGSLGSKQVQGLLSLPAMKSSCRKNIGTSKEQILSRARHCVRLSAGDVQREIVSGASLHTHTIARTSHPASRTPHPKTGTSHPETRTRIVQIASAEIGVREAAGRNDGKRVEEYLRYTHLGKGHEWCAAFVSWCYGQAGLPQPRNPWSPALFPNSRTYRIGYVPPLGVRGIADLFGIYGSTAKRINHVGLIKAQQGQYLVTIEGNSNNRVESRRRHLSTIYALSDWITK